MHALSDSKLHDNAQPTEYSYWPDLRAYSNSQMVESRMILGIFFSTLCP